MNTNQNGAAIGGSAQCAQAAPEAAQQVIRERVYELRAQAAALSAQADRLDILEKSLPPIMLVDAHLALGQLVRSSRF
jgi:hypothetical protein